jgi:hypothetical protein
MGCQMLGRSAQQSGQWNNGKTGRDKDQQWIGSKDLKRDRQRDEDE